MTSSKKVFAIIILFFLASCLPPSDEQIDFAIKQTESARKTSTPILTATPVNQELLCPIEEKLHPEWETIFCELFDNNDMGWWVGTSIENGLNSSIRSGKYILDYSVREETGYISGFSNSLIFMEASDYVYSLKGEVDSIFRNAIWGVMVRGDFEDGYAFSIDNQGNYFLTDYSATGEVYIGNAKYGSHSAIKWGEPNTITALIDGKDMSFYVNGTAIYKHTCKNPSNQEIGWYVWGAEGVTAIYEFDSVLIREKDANFSILN
jgi:hypothetical protein